MLAACGGGSSGGVSSADTGGNSVAPPVLVKKLLSSSYLDKSRYLGGWSSCTLMSNGQFYGNHITFSISNTNLVFVPAIGIVGMYADAACTQAVPGGLIGVTPVVGTRITSFNTTSITSQATSPYSGTADSLPDMKMDAYKFIAFSADYQTLYASPTSSFETVIIYTK